MYTNHQYTNNCLDTTSCYLSNNKSKLMKCYFLNMHLMLFPLHQNYLYQHILIILHQLLETLLPPRGQEFLGYLYLKEFSAWQQLSHQESFLVFLLSGIFLSLWWDLPGMSNAVTSGPFLLLSYQVQCLHPMSAKVIPAPQCVKQVYYFTFLWLLLPQTSC